MKKIYSAIFCVLIPASSLWAIDYGVALQSDSNTIYFNSSAKLEFLGGKTQHITGNFRFDPDNPSSAVAGILSVDLRTLKTGIDKRDEHMRNNHLHTDKYPYAYFELLSVDSLPHQMSFDSIYNVKAKGNFYIHGYYREVEANLMIVRKTVSTGGESLNVVADFDICLDEFKIPRPKALFLKLAETVNIKAVFTGSSQITAQSVELPDWPKLD